MHRRYRMVQHEGKPHCTCTNNTLTVSELPGFICLLLLEFTSIMASIDGLPTVHRRSNQKEENPPSLDWRRVFSWPKSSNHKGLKKTIIAPHESTWVDKAKMVVISPCKLLLQLVPCRPQADTCPWAKNQPSSDEGSSSSVHIQNRYIMCNYETPTAFNLVLSNWSITASR